jgi:hypothetical protein
MDGLAERVVEIRKVSYKELGEMRRKGGPVIK